MRSNLFFAALGIFFVSLVFTYASTLDPSRIERVVDGKISTIEDFPYLVVVSGHHNQSVTTVCGGSILTPHIIITAAHCVRHSTDPSSYQVRVGSSFRKRGGSLHTVQNFALHPGFRLDEHNNSENDVALLKLEEPIDFDGKTRKPIVMFEYGEEIKPGIIGKVAGWGRLAEGGILPKQIYRIKLKILDKKKCFELNRDIDGFQDGEICAVSASSNRKHQSICSGDSGGPLVISGRLAGIVAHSENCGSLVYPNVFTEVAYFRKWIDNRMMFFEDNKIAREINVKI